MHRKDFLDADQYTWLYSQAWSNIHEHIRSTVNPGRER